MRRELVLLSGILLLLFTGVSAASPALPASPASDRSGQEGYTAVVRSGDGFIAARSGGRIDWINASGEIIKSENPGGEGINSLLVSGQIIIAAGNNGSLLIGSDQGNFRKVDCGAGVNMNSLTRFKKMIVVGTGPGGVLVGDESCIFSLIPLDLKGNIVSVSANDSDCYGATDRGEIIHSRDGVNWDIFDFNQHYAGFYKPCRFTKILVTENQVALTGKQDDGRPVLYFSSGGKVWTERSLIYTDQQGLTSYLEDQPNDIYDDPLQDRFFLVCDRGKIMTIPSCSHCNELFELGSENLTGITANGNTVIVVGENGFLKTVSLHLLTENQ
ncbi:MAG: hypothetical protein R6W31_19220 [Bacteroidales bacterium]